MSNGNPLPEIGQIWRDNDQRTKGSGEFTIVSMDDDRAEVRRDGGRVSHIRLDRFADRNNRGFTYLGMSK